VKNVEAWKRNELQKLENSGKSYINVTGNIVNKTLQTSCSEKGPI